MPLSKAEIAALIPHGGEMCLLDGAQSWDERSIVCTATGHRNPANPLCDEAGLRAVCGIEYAAQAIALHAALAALGAPGVGGCKRGLLASARDVVMSVDRLDDVAGELTIRADRLMAHGDGVIYRFAVCDGPDELVQGRLAVCWLRDGQASLEER